MRPRGVAHADIAAGAADVGDEELLAEPFRQTLCDQPRDHIGDAAGREWHDDFDGVIRVACRVGAGRRRIGCRAEQHCRDSNSFFHVVFPCTIRANQRVARHSSRPFSRCQLRGLARPMRLTGAGDAFYGRP